MFHRFFYQFIVGTICIAWLSHCGTSTLSTQGQLSQLSPIDNSLAGKWKSDCKKDSDDNYYSQSQYTFGANKELKGQFFAFKDAACTIRFTDAEIAQIRQQIYQMLVAMGTPPSEAAKYADYAVAPYRLEGLVVEGNFSVGQSHPNNTSELDTALLFNGKITRDYIVFQIQDSKLFMTESCKKINEDIGCSKITGTSPENREMFRNLYANPHHRINL